MSMLNDPRISANERDILRRFTAEYPVKVGELAQALGLTVVRAPLQPKISGLIKPSDRADSGFEIHVNKYESPERQRFTVAHEIAHFLLHRDDIGSGVVDSIMYRSNLTSRKEAEANKLAADIVMPFGAVSKEVSRRGVDRTVELAEALAADFKVSVPAMKIRLGLV
jgi:Zn-dependent peptidase ImmA (M78 family)